MCSTLPQQYVLQPVAPATTTYQYQLDPTTGQYIVAPTGPALSLPLMGGLMGGAMTMMGLGTPEKPRNPPTAGYKCKWCGQPGGEPGAHWHNQCTNKAPAPPPEPKEPKLPTEGYTCKWCGKPGGLPDSHWHHTCLQNPALMAAPVSTGFKERGPPTAGYKCKFCGKEGGQSDSHWHNNCPMKDGPAPAAAALPVVDLQTVLAPASAPLTVPPT